MAEIDRSQEYSPERIDFWLRHWELLDALVESPTTALHHLSRFHEKHATQMVEGYPCEEPPPGSGWRLSVSYAETRADVTTAAKSLAIKKNRIVALISQGKSLNEVVQILGRNRANVLKEYRSALEDMAKSLGWGGPP